MTETQAAPLGGKPAGLLVVVPRALPSRVGYLGSLLVGSGIEVVFDRRYADRRRGPGRRSQERRHEDRRGRCRLVGYLYGCSIVRAGAPTSTQPAATDPFRSPPRDSPSPAVSS